MKLTLLLLVVFVSTTLASPFYLRGRDQRPHGPGRQGGDNRRPKQKPDSSEDREGPCERAMKRCEGEVPSEESPASVRSATEGSEQQAVVEADVNECERLIDGERIKLEETVRRDLNTDDEELQELDEKINECKAKIEMCAIPKENPARRVLQLLVREGETEGTDPCQVAREKMETIRGDDSEDSGEDSQGSESEKRKVLRELIHALYSRK
ncbi:uncharacterized protein LOC123537821 [Mercenaria mercenaria]|uniref:uncharacterized protein LOC123537821 n=1 Tax=Mercenaria mercenaria TaxID=6596 RepID=UPI00234E6213|nr:uncharacterized protein LOC123537821 [Mercenaria mercenaria]XP_053385351.1 uncharacterized protein LOC123537821 [Mercenaria mercenaria]